MTTEKKILGYDKSYPMDVKCLLCGHAYYRHFDWGMAYAQGCKFCDCLPTTGGFPDAVVVTTERDKLMEQMAKALRRLVCNLSVCDPCEEGKAALAAYDSYISQQAGGVDGNEIDVRVVRPMGGGLLGPENEEPLFASLTDDRNCDPIYSSILDMLEDRIPKRKPGADGHDEDCLCGHDVSNHKDYFDGCTSRGCDCERYIKGKREVKESL